MKKLTTIITLSLMSIISLSGCSPKADTNVQAVSQNKTSSIDGGIDNMNHLNQEIQKAIQSGDVDLLKKNGELINRTWDSFENQVKEKYAMEYVNIEKYLNPLVAGAKSGSKDKNALGQLSTDLGKALETLSQATKNPNASKSNASLQSIAETYHTYVIKQSEELNAAVSKLSEAIEKGDLPQAKQQYAQSRVYYERIEPIAESFGDLDPKIDAREDDEEAKENWTGFHEIEKALWVNNQTKGQEKFAKQLIEDVNTLTQKIKQLTIKPEQTVAGAVELLNEASTSKITGEEERYSHIDLVDLSANMEGSKAAFDAIKPELEKNDKELAQKIEDRFAILAKTISAYKQGEQFVSYTSLKSEDTKKISKDIDGLAEPLSQVTKIFN